MHLIPPEPSYPTTPAKLLESGAADLAICPSESCIAYAESSKPNFHLQAIYAICQTDASAIVSMKGGKVEKISDLGKGKAGGGKYGSFNARYEDEIVRAMVEKDGGDGKGMQVVSHEGKLSLFDKVREGKGEVDATWVFLPWEGVIAEMAGEELNVFMLGELYLYLAKLVSVLILGSLCRAIRGCLRLLPSHRPQRIVHPPHRLCTPSLHHRNTKRLSARRERVQYSSRRRRIAAIVSTKAV